MIGAQHQQVVVAQHRSQLRQSHVEFLQRVRIAFDVTAVPVQHVEVDEIGEHERAIGRALPRLQRRVEQRGIAGGLHLATDTPVRVDIGDLADADDLAAGLHQLVEHRVRRRRHGQVAAIARAFEVAAIGADERPRNHPAHVVVVDQLARDIADVVQALQAEGLFVAGDLEHAVGRSVDDRLAAAHVFLAELRDDGGAGGMAGAEHSRQPCPVDEFPQQLLRERIGLPGEIAPLEEHRHTRHFPMPARRVLAARELAGIAPGAGHFGRHVAARRKFAGTGLGGVQKPKARKVRDPQRAARRVPVFRDVAERVRAAVAEALGVGAGADTEGVQHQDYGSGHRCFSGAGVTAGIRRSRQESRSSG